MAIDERIFRLTFLSAIVSIVCLGIGTFLMPSEEEKKKKLKVFITKTLCDFKTLFLTQFCFNYRFIINTSIRRLKKMNLKNRIDTKLKMSCLWKSLEMPPNLKMPFIDPKKTNLLIFCYIM
jgi:hypothetical protein